MSILTTIMSITSALTLTLTSAPSITSEAPSDELAYPYCPTSLCLTDTPELHSQAYDTLAESDEVQTIEVPFEHDIRYTLLGYTDAPVYVDPAESSALNTVQVTDSEGTTFVFSYSFESAKLYNV